MSATVEQVQAQFEQEASLAVDVSGVEQLRVRFLGKKGLVAQLMRQLGQIEPADRPAFGARINALKGRIKDDLDALRVEVQEREEQAAVDAGWLDPTLPVLGSRFPSVGHLHPITRVLSEVLDHFRGLGFEAVSGPELEDEWHNFDALNIPKDHPARDVWDTFYLQSGEVPRTHTSSVQVRTLTGREPPLRIVAPGRCFRNETIDATHLACFNQVEGLLVDRDVTIGHLKATLESLVERLMGYRVPTRFRPAFYPFVEPGLDLDIECLFCRGRGCSICKGSGWIEVIPCGLVHPNVLRNCGHDPEIWSGFAFGMGFDRMVMLRYGIDDLRRLYDGRLDLVRQF